MEKITLKKIFKNDGMVIHISIAALIFLIISFLLLFTEKDEAEIMSLEIVGILFVGSLIFIFARIINLLTFKKEEKVYPATILKTFYYRGQLHVKFEYALAGIMYKKTNILLLNKSAKQLKKGDVIEIYVSISNPKKALIRDFYFDTINL